MIKLPEYRDQSESDLAVVHGTLANFELLTNEVKSATSAFGPKVIATNLMSAQLLDTSIGIGQ